MNDRSDIDRTLQVWMADGPHAIPARVVDVVAARIAVQRQRRAWPPLEGRTTVTQLKLAAAVAAAVIVAVLGYNLLPRDGSVGGPSASPAPTASQAGNTAAPTTAPPSPALNPEGPCGLPSSTCRGEIGAGTYESRGFEPQLTYTLPAGSARWFNTFDRPHGYGLVPWNAANQGAARQGGSFRTTVETWRGLAVARADCVEAPEPGVGRTARAIVDALHDRAGVDATDPAPVNIGGLAGFTIDFRLEPDWSATCPQGRDPNVPLVVDPRATPGTGLHWGAVEGERYRFIVLDTGEPEESILISIWSDSPEGWDAHLAQASRVVDSFEFGS